MSSAKTERLVNLTMALLDSKRYMTKAEIFRRVAGYSGEPDAKERMFERDKDDLRSLGIEIEVGGHDPLFEDEPGYRIQTDTYRIPPESFTAEELGIIATALSNWEGSAFGPASQSLLRRIRSLSVAPDLGDLPKTTKIDIDEERLLEISQALAQRCTIEFEYQKSNLDASHLRRVNPLGICAWRSAWYLVGEDLERKDVRVFKLARFASLPVKVSNPDAYEIPSDFAISDYVMMYQAERYAVRLRLRSGAGLALRTQAALIENIDTEWDLVTIEFALRSEALREVLWLADEVVVIEPAELREEVIAILKKMAAQNG